MPRPSPSPASKPRFALFSVGRNKPSPARVASIKRASLRHSAIRTDALKLPPLAFEHGPHPSPDSDEAQWEQHPRTSAPQHTPLEAASQTPARRIKDTALPSLPQEPAQQPPASAPTPRSRPAERPPVAPAADARIEMSGPSRLPLQAAPMPPSRTQPQAPSGSGSNNIFRRFTNKLRSSSTHPPSARSASTPAKSPPDAPVPERKRTGLRMPIALPTMPKAPVPAPPPNDFTSREQRQAALRARGLLPNVPSPYRDANGFMVSLSQQEAELDRRYTVVVDDKESSEAESEAKKIREAWLARNRDAEGASVRGSLDIAGSVGEDAARCAGRDGMLGDRSPVRATFVDASSPTEIASPLEVTVEDFHTAPSSPSAAPPSLSVSTDPPAALTDTPRSSLTTDDAQTPLAASPAGTVRAKPRKEKPPPIIVTTQRPSSSFDSKRVPAPQVVAFTGAAPSDSEASITSDERSSLETRGRPGISAGAAQRQSRDQPPLLGHSVSSGSSNGTGSRANTLPALSPTRTVSSSGAESALPTPTTTSCQRDVSISRGSTSHSSDQSHGDDSFAKGKVGAPLIQSSPSRRSLTRRGALS